MHDIRPAYLTSVPILAMLALAGCSGGGLGSLSSNSTPAAAPSAPPINMAGVWQLSSPGRGQCRMTFGAAGPAAAEGTIAPQGGCPGKFFTSRKWSYDQGGLVMRDHNGQPLAQLSGEGGQFNGKSTGGEPVALMR